jgi:hypothetical protein
MFVVTDLTQFNKDGKVCLAALHTETGQCIRPMPYLSEEFCCANGVKPGTFSRANLNDLPQRPLISKMSTTLNLNLRVIAIGRYLNRFSHALPLPIWKQDSVVRLCSESFRMKLLSNAR